jgi:hypothetical protein
MRAYDFLVTHHLMTDDDIDVGDAVRLDGKVWRVSERLDPIEEGRDSHESRFVLLPWPSDLEAPTVIAGERPPEAEASEAASV